MKTSILLCVAAALSLFLAGCTEQHHEGDGHDHGAEKHGDGHQHD